MEFTDEMLYTIERDYDVMASQNTRETADFLKKFEQFMDKPAIKEHVEKVLAERIKAHDAYREISAVCQLIREKRLEGE